MVLVGGLCAVLLGLLNEAKRIRKWPMVLQALFGITLIVWPVELLSGYLLNTVGELGVWYYGGWEDFTGTHLISLKTGLLFLLIYPKVAWLDDELRHRFFGEEYTGSLAGYYFRFITFKK